MLMSSVEDSPARIFPAQGREREFMPKEVGCGGKCSGSFAWYDPDTSLWRTWQRCLTGGWMKYLGRWPKSGMMQNGKSYLRTCLEPHTSDEECSLLPTPVTGGLNGGSHHREMLIRMFGEEEGKKIFGGKLMNPCYIEAMMGYPKNYTEIRDLEHSETQ